MLTDWAAVADGDGVLVTVNGNHVVVVMIDGRATVGPGRGGDAAGQRDQRYPRDGDLLEPEATAAPDRSEH